VRAWPNCTRPGFFNEHHGYSSSPPDQSAYAWRLRFARGGERWIWCGHCPAQAAFGLRSSSDGQRPGCAPGSRYCRRYIVSAIQFKASFHLFIYSLFSAHYIKDLGIGKVVGISSQFGYYVNQEGIDVDLICTQRHAALARDPSLDSKVLESGLTPAQLASSAYHSRLARSTDDEHLCTFLSDVRAEVFAPCAGRYVVSTSVLETLAQQTFAGVPVGERYIIAGANNIMHPTRDESSWLAALDNAGISMLPEWVSNSGTASVFMRACSGSFTLDRPDALLMACGQDCERFLERVCRRNESAGKDQFTSSRIFATCYDVARETRARGPLNRLGVERIAHIDCITTAPARAYKTFTEVIGAQSIASAAGSQRVRLPGADDPSLSVVPAPENATPADTGLHVFFAVTNLARTRAVLERDNLAFSVSHSVDLGEVLELNGETGGYPMGFVQATGPAASAACSDALSVVMKNVGVKQLDHCEQVYFCRVPVTESNIRALQIR
jgi:hypothetical protein